MNANREDVKETPKGNQIIYVFQLLLEPLSIPDLAPLESHDDLGWECQA